MPSPAIRTSPGTTTTTTPAGGTSSSGPGKAIDTDRYFVICPNILGGCRGTTGPNSINPATGKPYGARFPDDHRRRHGRGPAAAGRSPGHRAAAGGGRRLAGRPQVLAWATRYPDAVAGAVAVATSPRLTQPGAGLRRRRPQRHPPRPALPRRAVLRQRPGPGRRAWPSPACSGTSPTSRARR